MERIAVVADRGYFKIEDIEACEKAGINPHVPRPQRGPSVRAGLFRKDECRYDPTSDSLLCPAGQHLHPYSSSLLRGLKKINYRNSHACRDFAIRSQCLDERPWPEFGKGGKPITKAQVATYRRAPTVREERTWLSVEALNNIKKNPQGDNDDETSIRTGSRAHCGGHNSSC